ncbi:MAG: ROK family protein [Chloroflexi bacterium]|nr:ROK family protein [Chloroflexota bacterium]
MSPYAIGIDLGGTKIAGALVSATGVVAAQERIATQAEEGFPAVIARLAQCARRLERAAKEPIAGIGVGAAGMTDSRRGVVIAASNLKWTNVPLRDLLAEQLGKEPPGTVWVDKDTNAAALGEMLYGAGRGSQDFLYVTVGSGVGGGMVLDGRLYRGAREGASEMGHLVIDPAGPTCGCGKRGCVEALASGPAIARQARQALKDGFDSKLRVLDPETVTAVQVVEAARGGDPLAISVLTAAGRTLGIALSYYVDINNPDRIIVGGGVAAAGELLLDPIRRTIAERALPANSATVKVVGAGLGSESGAVGAAALVWYNTKGNSQ